MNPEQLNRRLVEWIAEQARAAGVKGAVIGMSGGIDSAVVAVLCKQAFPEATLGLALPCHSIPQDEEHARLVAEKFAIPLKTIVLDPVFDTLVRLLPADDGVDSALQRKAQSNLKPRLRMLTLYYFANRSGYMVVGSGNRSELSTGYFSKHGDGGVDILPIGNLVKEQVKELALFLDIPRPIIDKLPSAGLWEGQTDEGEMGLTYADLDRYLLTGKATAGVKRKIDLMSAASQHKRQMPPIPGF